MTSDAITATSAAATGTLLSTMVIFNDPLYFYLACMSAVVGGISSMNDLDEMKKLKLSFYAFFISFKGAFIGFFAAPLVMLTLVIFGNQIASKVGFDIKETNILLISFYWILSMLFSRIITFNILYFLQNKGGK